MSGACSHIRGQRASVWLIWLGVLLGCLGGAATAWAQPPAPPGELSLSLGEQAWVLKDESGKLSLEQVSRPPWSARFAPNRKSFLGAGTVAGALWVRLPPLGPLMAPHRPQPWLLELGKQFVDQIEFFLPLRGGGWRRVLGGREHPSHGGLALARVPAVRLPGDLDPQRPVYLRLASQFGLGMPIIMRQERAFQRQVMTDSYIYGLLYGAPLALALFNLFVFISLRDRVYLYYVIFILSLLSYQVILHGQTRLVGLFAPHLGLVLFGVLAGVSFFFGALFSKTFLLTRRHAPFWDKVLSAYMALAALRVLMSLIGWHQWGNHLAQFMGLAAPVLSIAAGLVAWRRGFSPAIYYVVAWAVLSLCVVWHVLVSFSLLPWNNLSSMMMGVGSALEAILLSFALADRIRALRRERESLALTTRRLHLLSNQDELTGLFNSRHFRQRLPILVGQARDQNQALSMIMLDIDDFKRFNDTYGHPQGDQVLTRLGKVIAQCVRFNDLACRYGGEEFAVILPGAGIAQASQVAERIRQQFSQERFQPRNGVEVGSTASLGVAQLRPDEDGQELLQRADQELYRAKSAGKNRTMVAP